VISLKIAAVEAALEGNQDGNLHVNIVNIYLTYNKHYYNKQIIEFDGRSITSKYITVTSNVRLDLPQLSLSKASQSLDGLMALFGELKPD